RDSGAAFAPVVDASRRAFGYVKGADLLQTHQAESGTKRAFCRQCGSTLSCFVDGDDLIEIAAATLDTPIDLRPEYHIYVRSKVSWFDIQDGKPQHRTTSTPGADPRLLPGVLDAAAERLGLGDLHRLAGDQGVERRG